VRLFPNDRRIRFENPVHELVEPSLKKIGMPVKACRVPVHHYGKLDEVKGAAKGEAYYQLGKQKIEALGNDLNALCELAIQAGGLGRYEEAIELWLRIIALNPNLPGAYFNLGYDYLQLGKFEEAIAVTLKARELNPGLREAVVNWSIAELCIGDTNNAITELEGLLRECPEFLPAVNMLAAAYCSNGRKDEGLALFASLQGMDITAFLQDIAQKLISAGRHAYANSLLVAVQGNYPFNAELTELVRGASPCAARA